MKETIETFQFTDLEQLRNWLNAFSDTELSTIYPSNDDYIHLAWERETLSDGSEVFNVRIRAD